ncbi:MAG: lipocalin family protein [Imperialibacter sp.]|uniref:lipocalin family protein n=1 Tax=Imperialibacter sp. TaxID=2038411 RepID=UPI0032EE9991
MKTEKKNLIAAVAASMLLLPSCGGEENEDPDQPVDPKDLLLGEWEIRLIGDDVYTGDYNLDGSRYQIKWVFEEGGSIDQCYNYLYSDPSKTDVIDCEVGSWSFAEADNTITISGLDEDGDSRLVIKSISEDILEGDLFDLSRDANNELYETSEKVVFAKIN